MHLENTPEEQPVIAIPTDTATRLVEDACSNDGNTQDLSAHLQPYRQGAIYAFGTFPGSGHTKVGYTGRPVPERIREWQNGKTGFPELVWDEDAQQWPTAISDNREAPYFRDEPVHAELRKRGFHQLTPQELAATGETGITREAFDADIPNSTIGGIIADLKVRAVLDSDGCGFPLYSPLDRRKETDLDRLREARLHKNNLVSHRLRPMQRIVLDNVEEAIKKGRRKLLLAAAPRFGKTLTVMKSTQLEEVDARFVVVACAMANAKIEWAETVLLNEDFADFEFLESADLDRDRHILDKIFAQGKRAVVFTTLADLQGKNIKKRHEQLYEHELDCLFIDETHYGARGESYSAKLGDADDDTDVHPGELRAAVDALKLKPKLRIDISGTPYDILASGEYSPEDIVCAVRYEDMYREKLDWFKENPGAPETDNPYFGLPQILKMAFTLSSKDSELLRDMREAGVEGSLLEVFATDDAGKLRHRKLAKKFLSVFMGISSDNGFMSLLADPTIIASRMGDHIVIALDRKAACNEVAGLLEGLLSENGRAGEYEVISICSAADQEPTAASVRKRISAAAKENRKTISLTVNRMLTATSVPEWSLMLYAKRGSSAQAYIQAMLRLGTAWVVDYADGAGNRDKRSEKEQALFIDLDPVRMLAIQAQMAHLAARDKRRGGDASAFEDILRGDLEAMPALLVDNAAGKCHQVTFEDAMSVAAAHLTGEDGDVDAIVKGIGIDEGLRADDGIMEQLANSYKGSSVAVKLLLDKELDDADEDSLDDIDGLGEAAETALSEPDDSDGGETTAPDGDADNAENADGNEDDDDERLDDKTYREMVRDFYRAIVTLAFCAGVQLGSLEGFIEYHGREEHAGDLAAFDISYDALVAFAGIIAPYVTEDFDFAISNVSSVRHSKTMSVEQKSDTVFGQITSFSTNEVPTPKYIVVEMFDAIGDEKLNGIIDDGKRILEIGSQRCEFTEYLIRHMRERDFANDAIGEAVAVIPSSAAAGVLVRTLMEMYGVPTDNVASFSMMDLYAKIVETDYDYTGIARILCQAGKSFSEISLDDEVGEDAEMIEFGAVVGNPPYQQTTKDTSDKPIYPLFMDLSEQLAPLSLLITPARFLFNAGKTPSAWNKAKLSDKYFSVIEYYPRSKDVFPGAVDVKGGIAITKYDRFDVDGKPIGTYSAFPELNSIIQKVTTCSTFSPITRIIHQQSKFNLEVLYAEFPQAKENIGSDGREKRLTTKIFTQVDAFTEERVSEDDIEIQGLINNVRYTRFIPQRFVLPQEDLNAYKVIVPASNGSGALGEVLSTPLIGTPLIGYTQSFIGFGVFSTRDEAEAALKYIKSMFARTMLGTLKVTQHNHKDTWRNVPIQDFTVNSDIDWSKSVSEIDQQLYKKYGLDENEIQFIKNHIRFMK